MPAGGGGESPAPARGAPAAVQRRFTHREFLSRG
nr:MAG TPA: hypothetical protein [Caudoviricetes sp.]